MLLNVLQLIFVIFTKKPQTFAFGWQAEYLSSNPSISGILKFALFGNSWGNL